MTVANYVNLLEEQGARPGQGPKPDIAHTQSKGRAQQGRASARVAAGNTVPGSGATPNATMKTPRPSAGQRAMDFTKKVGKRLVQPVSAKGRANAQPSKLGKLGKAGKFLGKASGYGLALQGGLALQEAVQGTLNDDLDYLHERMLSDDPEVSRQAINEYRLSQGQNGSAQPQEGGAQPNQDVAPGDAAETGEVAPSQGVNPNDPGQPGSQQAGAPAPGNDEAATEIYMDENGSQEAGPALNAKMTRPIEGSEYEYAGRYGDTDVIKRDTVPSGRPDGDVVPEYSDQASSFGGPANGLQRPGQEAADAESRARADQSREDYVRNTTMSDGRRVFSSGGEAGGGNTIGEDGQVQFGKSSQERLRSMQMTEAGKGDADGVVARQLAEEGRTPEQRAAYAADPAGTYANEQAAEAAVAKNRLASMKDNFAMNRDMRKDARAEQTEQRRTTADAQGQLSDLLKGWETVAGTERQAVMLEAQGMYDSPANNLSMPQILQQIMDNVITDGELPVLSDGKLQYKQQQGQGGVQRPAPSAEVAPFI